MKKYLFALLFGLLYLGCHQEDDLIDPGARVDGLTLYWDHEIFGKEGRRLRFEFYETKAYKNTFDLIFDYTIKGKEIVIVLKNKIDKGECPKYPGWSDLCTPKGRIYIPENLLTEDRYTLIIKTFDFESISNLIADEDKYSMEIPANEKFTCSIKNVYPIPADLLMGSLVFSGKENTVDALLYIEKLEKMGLKTVTLPDFPYRHLDVGENGKPIETHWEPDNHSLPFLYKMDISFRIIFELSKEHFRKSNLNISLFSSNGDEAHLSKLDGEMVIYAK